MRRYPKRLLAHSKYKKIKDLRSSFFENHFVIRFSENLSQINKDRIRQDHFPSPRFYKGISTVLVGVYKKRDSRVQLKKCYKSFGEYVNEDPSTGFYIESKIPKRASFLLIKDYM